MVLKILKVNLTELEDDIVSAKISPVKAAQKILEEFKKSL